MTHGPKKEWDKILLAHRKAMLNNEPGIFQAFKVTAIEYVVKEEDSLKKLRNLEKRGVTLVKITKDVDLQTKIEKS